MGRITSREELVMPPCTTTHLSLTSASVMYWELYWPSDWES